MHKPAARIGDDHVCPQATPGTPPIQHVGGPVVGPGCPTVLIEGRPAARLGDVCFCVGEPDTIATGSLGVFIGGLPAARLGDSTEHGGKVITGCTTVLIGNVVDNDWLLKIDDTENKDKKDDFIEPSKEEKNWILNQAICECIFLLERKLKLLSERDLKTMDDFIKWFGWDDDEAVKLILNRITKALNIAQYITTENFDVIKDEKAKRSSFALVHYYDEFHTISLGDLFWDENEFKNCTRGMVLIHELSHFYDIGNTSDFEYGIAQCLYLSKYERRKALYNAESFEHFINA